uniref:Uncharacterized protein n=1 Tax=Trypanosoma congolense (strain IL3000) TaxID=1068625 RepID=G0UXP6_TRYCI|nr:conserved hypothetical protein [Trypanosoma congolense IL3000]
MPVGPSPPQGVKRQRDGVGTIKDGARDGDTSSHSAVIEITNGMTRTAATEYEEKSAAFASLFGSSDLLLNTIEFRHTTRHFLVPPLSAAFDGPLEFGVVRLVANNDTTLMFTSDAVAPVTVSPDVGRCTCMGDVVLLQRLRALNVLHDDEERDQQLLGTHMEFLAIDASSLTDASDWCHAAFRNVVVITGWIQELLSHPPGLAQLTCIVHSFVGPDEPYLSSNSSANMRGGWWRSLQLPLLLRRLRDVPGVDKQKVLYVNKVIFSVVRLYVSILTTAESILPPSQMLGEVVYQFIASPLFVDGLTLVWSEMANSVSNSMWVGAQQILSDAVWLGLRYTCSECSPVINGEIIGRSLPLEKQRVGAALGLHTVLHRLTSMWMKGKAARDGASVEPQSIIGAVDGMASSGVFRYFVNWTRSKERVAGLMTVVDNAHVPPTLKDIAELRGLGEGTVKEMMTIMTRIYTPYLRQEALHFVETAVQAAYAEFYGPAARAVRKFLTCPTSFKSGRHDKNVMDQPSPHIRVVGIKQLPIRSALSSYSLEEVRLHALFGLPVRLTLRIAKGEPMFVQISKRPTTFGYLLVRLSESEFVFPLIVSDVPNDSTDGYVDERCNCLTCEVDGYVLRDRDMLPSILEASIGVASSHTAAEDLPEAWFFYDKDRGDDENISDNRATQFIVTTRFLPEGTPAVSYILYIRHLQSLRAWILQDERDNTSAIGRLKTPQGGNVFSPNQLLWWGSGTSKIAGDAPGNNSFLSATAHESDVDKLFVPHAALGSDGEHLRKYLDELTEATSLTASQVECIHTLAATGTGVRTLVGAVGSGKTTIMHAAGLVRGRVNQEIRREHTPLWHSTIKRSRCVLSEWVSKLAGVEEIEDLFHQEGFSCGRDLLEEVTNEAISHMREHVLLSENLKGCQSPLLLRPRAEKDMPPHRTARVLHEATVEQKYQSLEAVMRQGCDRSAKAPLAAVLSSWLHFLRRLGDLVSAVQETSGDESKGEWRLFTEFLPWIMSRKEQGDTLAQSQRCQKSWDAFLASDIWDSATVRSLKSLGATDSGDGNEVKQWRNVEPLGDGTFRAVVLPNPERSLCEYGKAEAAGWKAVFGEKQKELLAFLQQKIMDETQHIFTLFLDLVHMVAATSQASKATVLTATRVGLLRSISFLQAWKPRYLVVDDYDQIEDSVYLTLSPASVVILSQQMDPPLQLEQQVALAVLKGVQKELQGTPLSSTVVLSESLRFATPELHKAILICRNSPLITYAASRGGVQIVGSTVKGTNGGCDGPGGGTLQHGQAWGLSSHSCVELWTHAVPASMGVACDGLGAVFVRARIKQVKPEGEVNVYCSCARDRDIIIENMLMGSEVSQAVCSAFVRVVPLHPDAFVERDEECDIAIICLSGLTGSLGYARGAERRKRWERLIEDNLFVEYVERWLWKTASRARYGVLFIGSKELFQFLEPLRRVERFVQQERDRFNYWLPADAKWAVLALRCPEHADSRQLAMLTYSDYSGCEVRTIGTQKCQSLCLAPFNNCTNSAHACIHVCHSPSAFCATCSCCEGSETSDLHNKCPFPCARVQPCGHVCLRSCSESCSPCEFVGLQLLSCGQSVIKGVSDNGPTTVVVRHFQEVRCGEAPRPCEENVTVRCPRCKGKLTMRCCDLTARGGFDGVVPEERECNGCVALYNRVAKEFGVPEVEMLPSSASTSESTELSLPVHRLPDDAREKFRKLVAITFRKGQLMMQKEALETMQGISTTEFHQHQEAFNRNLKQQQEELRRHSERAQEITQLWTKKLKQKCDSQMVANEKMEAEVPLMVSEAIAEEQRQQQFNYA